MRSKASANFFFHFWYTSLPCFAASMYLSRFYKSFYLGDFGGKIIKCSSHSSIRWKPILVNTLCLHTFEGKYFTLLCLRPSFDDSKLWLFHKALFSDPKIGSNSKRLFSGFNPCYYCWTVQTWIKMEKMFLFETCVDWRSKFWLILATFLIASRGLEIHKIDMLG